LSGRPLIAADTIANRDLLTHGRTAYLRPAKGPEALAAAILEVSGDESRREQLAAAGHALYLEKCSEAVIEEHLRSVAEAMLRSSRP